MSEKLGREPVDLEGVVCGDRRLTLRATRPDSIWLEVARHLDYTTPPRVRVEVRQGEEMLVKFELSVADATELRASLGWMLHGSKVPS